MTVMDSPTVAAPLYRRASTLDLDRLLALVQRFIATTSYAQYVGSDATAINRTLAWMLDYDGAVIFVAEVAGNVEGMLGLVEYTHPLSGMLSASELFWWLNPEHRGLGGWLLRRGETWAKSRGCQRLQMIAPLDNLRVQEMYTALGYTAIETAFQKDLT